MLTSRELAGVTPEVNLRITQARNYARDPPWLLKPGQTSPDVQNGYQRSYKKDLCPPKLKKKVYFLGGLSLHLNHLIP